MFPENFSKFLDYLTLSYIVLKNGQITWKILRCEHHKIWKVYLVIFQYYVRKDWT